MIPPELLEWDDEFQSTPLVITRGDPLNVLLNVSSVEFQSTPLVITRGDHILRVSRIIRASFNPRPS